jgi:hypothetical protein
MARWAHHLPYSFSGVDLRYSTAKRLGVFQHLKISHAGLIFASADVVSKGVQSDEWISG